MDPQDDDDDVLDDPRCDACGEPVEGRDHVVLETYRLVDKNGVALCRADAPKGTIDAHVCAECVPIFFELMFVSLHKGVW